MQRSLFFTTLLVLLFQSSVWANTFQAENDQCQVHAEIEQAVEAAQANSNTHRVFVMLRLSCNTAGVAYALNEFSEVPLEYAIPVGLIGGLLSAAQQLFHSKLTFWQTHRGWVRPDKKTKASMFEAFVLKEYSLHALYLGILHAAQAAYGIKSSFFSAQVFQTAFLSLLSDGFLNLTNVKATDSRITRLKDELYELSKTRALTLEDFKEFKKEVGRVWTLSKAAAVGISFGATVLAILDMEGVAWAAPILISAGGLGAAASFYLFRKEIHKHACRLRVRLFRQKAV